MWRTKNTRNLLKGADVEEVPPQQADRELLRLAIDAAAPNNARLWQTHPHIFERGGPPAELPPGWAVSYTHLTLPTICSV